MTFARTFDYDLVLRLITFPAGYRAAGDDFAPDSFDFQVNRDDRIWYVVAKSGATLLGAFIFLPQSAVCFEAHLCLLPAARGSAASALAGVIAWMFANSAARRIVGAVPEYNRLANHCAEHAGMTQYGTNFKSFLKDGKLHDLTLWGISKE